LVPANYLLTEIRDQNAEKKEQLRKKEVHRIYNQPEYISTQTQHLTPRTRLFHGRVHDASEIPSKSPGIDRVFEADNAIQAEQVK
jgi:hypothetical protein